MNTVPLDALSSSIECNGPRIGGAAHLGLGCFAVFAVALLGWGTFAPLAEASIASGQFRAEGNRRIVQHLEGGIVAEVLARDGDTVAAGQPLLRLETAQSAASRDALAGTVWSLSAELARLEAEAASAAWPHYPVELRAQNDPRAREAVVAQDALFAARAAAYESQRQVLGARLDRHAADFASARGQHAGQAQQVALLRLDEADARTLFERGLERVSRLRAIQRQISATDANLRDLSAQADRALAETAETERELDRLSRTRATEANAAAIDVRTRLQQVRQQLGAARDVANRHEVLAPEAGVVLASRFFNAGAVVRPGDTILEIVPANDRLLAEVRVAPTDIEMVHVGLPAEVRLPAYKQRLVPSLEGEVVFVGGDLTEDAGRGIGFYRARIAIDPADLAAMEGVELKAGMPVEAQIRTGERSFLRYLVQPLLDSFHRAFREA